MADPVKFLAQEITLGTVANNVSSGSLIRVGNLNAAPVLITQKYANGTTISTFTLSAAGNGFENTYIIKQPTDTLQSNATANVVAVSVGYY
jgi:hypothetical protein